MRRAIQINPSNKDYFWELARTYNFQKERGLALSVLDGMTRLLRYDLTSFLVQSDSDLDGMMRPLTFDGCILTSVEREIEHQEGV